MKTKRSRPLPHIVLVVLLVLAATFAATASASAATYCVHDPACPAGGVAKATLGQAIETTDEDAVPDTIRVGPGRFPTSNVSALKPVSIVGSGMGETEFEAKAGEVGALMYLTAGCRASDLTLRLTGNGEYGMRLSGGADAERVGVEASHSLTKETGIYVEDAGTDIRSVVVDLGPSLQGYAIGDGGGATIEDASLTAGIGLLPATQGTTARRLKIRAEDGIYMVGGALNVANVQITPYPDAAQAQTFEAIDMTGGNAGEDSLLNIADGTIVGPGSAGAGLVVRSNSSVNSGTVTANVHGVVIAGVTESIYRHGKSVTQIANVTIDHSAYSGAAVSDGAGNGAIAIGAGNLTSGVDPRFVDRAAGDYRPRFDSPLLDAGPPMPPLAGDDPDLSGRSRVRDSDGNGSAVRDIGAYEYQRLPPSAAFAISPPAAAAGDAIGFDAGATTDPDGDPLTYAWSFGDGAGAVGPTASHAYLAAGSYEATLAATDATGLTATATRTLQTSLPTLPTAPSAATISFGKVKLNKKKGTATLAVAASVAGTLTFGGRQLVKQRASASPLRVLKVTIKARGKALRALSRKGRVKVTTIVTLAPTGATKVVTKKTIVLKEKLSG